MGLHVTEIAMLDAALRRVLTSAHAISVERGNQRVEMSAIAYAMLSVSPTLRALSRSLGHNPELLLEQLAASDHDGQITEGEIRVSTDVMTFVAAVSGTSPARDSSRSLDMAFAATEWRAPTMELQAWHDDLRQHYAQNP